MYILYTSLILLFLLSHILKSDINLMQMFIVNRKSVSSAQASQPHILCYTADPAQKKMRKLTLCTNAEGIRVHGVNFQRFRKINKIKLTLRTEYVCTGSVFRFLCRKKI